MGFWDEYRNHKFEELLGKTLSAVNVGTDEIVFKTVDGEKYKLYHRQSCCQSVEIESITGDIQKLIGSPILQAEEVSNFDDNKGEERRNEYDDSFTWTFYKLANINEYVTIRWYGTSNGYYGEGVDFCKYKETEEED